MTHQCPKCELRFTWQTELDDHCRHDHPEFHHDYPASVHYDNPAPRVRAAGRPVPRHSDTDDSAGSTAAILATWWGERKPADQHPPGPAQQPGPTQPPPSA